MANVSVAAKWQLLYKRYYRKLELYQMPWKHVELARNKVVAAPFRGPLAVIRDDSKIVQLHGESALCKLRLFYSSGHLLADTVWRNPVGRLIRMSWTNDHTPVCIVQDGTVYRYDVHARLIEPNLSLGKECFENNVANCAFWGNDVFCITEENQLFCIADFKNPNAVKLADPGIIEPPRCLAMIEPQYTVSGNIKVFLGVGDGGEEEDVAVLAVEEDGVKRLGGEMLRGPLQKMVVSRDNKWLASFTRDGRLLVTTSDLTSIIIERECEVCEFCCELNPKLKCACYCDLCVVWTMNHCRFCCLRRGL